MLLIVSTIAIFFISKMDNYSKKMLTLSFGIILYSFSFAYYLKDHNIKQEVFIYDMPKMEWRFYFFYLMIIIGIFLGFYFENNTTFSFPFFKREKNYIEKHLITIYYVLSTLSIIAFLLNFQNVDIELLFVAPRIYERLFGKNTLINYIYFLNVPALIVSIFYKNYFKKSIYLSKLINFFLIFIGFFHGIKFTIFDTLLFPFTFMYYLKKINFSKVIIILLLMGIIFTFFGIIVRGGANILLTYTIPNVYNFIYSIEKKPLQFSFPLKLIFPRELYNENILSFIKYETVGITGYSLNDKYNVYTGFGFLYTIFNFLAPIFYFPIIITVTKKLFFTTTNNLYNNFILTYLMLSNLLMFFSWQFTKSKYLYYILILYLVDKISSYKKWKIIKKK